MTPSRTARRVVHLTSVHRPQDVRIFHKEARSLSHAGYEVFVVGQGDSSTIDGVSVVGVARAKSRAERFTRTIADVYRRAARLDGSLYHIHDPELIPAGLVLRLRGRLVVYDAHEELPLDVLSKHWIPRPLRHFVSYVARLLLWLVGRTFSGVVAATPSIGSAFPARKTVTILNYPYRDELYGGADRQSGGTGTPLFIHVGGVTAERSFYELAEAITAVPQRARLAFAGSEGDPVLLSQLASGRAGDRIDWLGWLERAELAALMGRATCGVVLLHPIPSFIESYPIKLFEYMSAGLPVIASDFPLWRRIIGDLRCGVLVNPRSALEIGHAMTWVVHHPDEARAMGVRGRAAIEGGLNWESEVGKLLAFYQRLFDRRHPVRAGE